ncbi:hypothetical protein N7481_011860 [Penicillium waksmanii]|uniref:uncharacterized protein n=1 Tax=Penicillium waksmanii TaxID=69791 RepID=UPI00254924A1|nr:uncharacterized protein N7481_011860 [Penicillium waksmanii]KAJ5974650.1 hypothetical protein N7481_011860 [Penicillium waksmanii]
MANTVTLLEYLQQGLVRHPSFDTSPGSNTQATNYNSTHIRRVDTWQEFNIDTITSEFAAILNGARIPNEMPPHTPPRHVNSEDAVRARAHSYLTNRVVRALRSGFNFIASTGQLRNFERLAYDVGSLACTEYGFPDFAVYDTTDANSKTRRNFVPGDVKVSWKWSAAWRRSNETREKKEYKQVLSQLNFYAKRNKTRYSFVLTNREFVAIERLDVYGHLKVSDAIPWDARGTRENPPFDCSSGDLVSYHARRSQGSGWKRWSIPYLNLQLNGSFLSP